MIKFDKIIKYIKLLSGLVVIIFVTLLFMYEAYTGLSQGKVTQFFKTISNKTIYLEQEPILFLVTYGINFSLLICILWLWVYVIKYLYKKKNTQ